MLVFKAAASASFGLSVLYTFTVVTDLLNVMELLYVCENK